MVYAGQQVISGKMGKCYTVINGLREELATLIDVEITFEKSKTEVPMMGKVVTGHKANGVSIKGSATIYYNTARFKKMIADYIATGVDTYFEMEVTNDDASAESGTQIGIAYGCNIDNGTLAKLDANSELLDESIDFTVEDWKYSQHFTQN